MDETTMHLTKTDRAVLESYKILCDGLANYLGEGYEIALHSLENYDSSVIKIINGYYTGRKEGAPITDLALHMLEDIKRNKSTQSARFPSIRKSLTARYKINGSNIPAKTAFPCQSRIKRNKPLVRSLYAAKT